MTEELFLSPQYAQSFNTFSQLGPRNQLAKDTIIKYSKRHGKMDVAVGAVGIFGFGFAMAALATAIAAQAPVIYQPLARDLGLIYTATADNKIRGIIKENVIVGGGFDIAAEFGTEFMTAIAGELVTEVGLGAATTFIPFVGALTGAALDYVIATKMTWRVGTMVSIYYQNGGNWIESRHHTFELAKEFTEDKIKPLSNLFSKWGGTEPHIDVNFDRISTKFPAVFETQVEHLRPLIDTMLQMGDPEQVRQLLKDKGIPLNVIDAALRRASTAASNI